MKNSGFSLSIAVVLLASGCASGPPFIDSMQPEALSVAARRGQFEMDCPTATAELLSRETVEPLSVRFGVVRAEYTVGVAGCGKRATYVVVCPDSGYGGSNCIAASGKTVIQ
ncbi:MAG: hypothetical protein GC183_09560 [Thiobacillus sp.]|nr:hypothetical protein [Thiobacillus sp.]